MRLAFALLLAVGSLPAMLTGAPVPKELKKPDDKTAIVGTWLGIGGDQVRFAFEADGTLRTWYGANPAGAMRWTWEVTDPKATPKRARINRAENPTAGYDCVYEFTPDGLKFALILSAGTKAEKVEPLSGLEFHAMTRDTSGK